MRRPISWLGAVMGILLLQATTAYAGEENVPLDKVPEPVMAAVKARFKDAVVSGAATEMNDEGKLVYEVSLKVEGQNIDVILAPEGEMRLIEKTIPAKNLPSAVAKTLKDKYPKAKYKRLEEIFKVEGKNETLAYYEAQLVTAKKIKLEVELSAEGNILKEGKVSD
ncbi:MAG: PepSY-like domain-containing protein [Methylobacter sp.]